MAYKGSINNRYNYELMKDEALRWLKEHDTPDNPKNKLGGGYGDQSNREYAYLTKKKEMTREYKETPMSNINKSNQNIVRGKIDLQMFDYEN